MEMNGRANSTVTRYNLFSRLPKNLPQSLPTNFDTYEWAHAVLEMWFCAVQREIKQEIHVHPSKKKNMSPEILIDSVMWFWFLDNSWSLWHRRMSHIRIWTYIQRGTINFLFCFGHLRIIRQVHDVKPGTNVICFCCKVIRWVSFFKGPMSANEVETSRQIKESFELSSMGR